MVKRIIAGILGAISALISILPLIYAFGMFGDFSNPHVGFWPTLLGEVLMCSIAAAALTLGISFLRFAASGHSRQSHSWLRPVALGIGFFFPGFLLSLPLTILWASLTWPGDGQNILAAFEVSIYVGLAAAIICAIVLLRKRATTH